MTDLANKFATFEEQVATQHTEVMEALNGIAFAIGAPPTTPTTNLSDIATMLTSIDFILASLVTAQLDQSTALLDVLGQINTTIDTMNSNNSLNAQRLLIAIAANDPCKPCDIVPIEPPPIDITPQLVDESHCKRMQALIYALRRLTVKLDVLSSFGLGFSPTVIRDAITEIITELGVTGLLEYPSLGEVAQIAGAGAAYVVSNIFGGGSLPGAFLSIEDALLPALYAADNASAGQAAYRSVLSGSSLSTPIVHLFEAMAYTSIFNLYYDSTIELDVSGYDGTICAPEEPAFECTTIASQVIGVTGYGSRNAIAWPSPFPSSNADEISNTYSANQVLLGDYQYCIFRLVSGPGARLLYFNAGAYAAVNIYVGTPLTIPTPTTSVWIDDLLFNTPFSVEICPPEPS